MTARNIRRSSLTPYQARKLREYEQILDATALNPERVYDLAEDDPQAVIPVLKSMTDQVVRSEVIFEYTMIDMELDTIIIRHFFGAGKKLKAAKRTKRYKTLSLMLQNTHMLQKLNVARSFKEIPKSIASKIAAINDLRNGLAHTFFVEDLKPSKRTYKGRNIFTKGGIEAFREDAQEIRNFFMPWLRKILEGSEENA